MKNSKSEIPALPAGRRNPRQIPNFKFQIPVIFVAVLIALLRIDFSLAQDTGYLWENFLKGEYNAVVDTAEEMLRRLPADKIDSEIYYLLGISYLEMGHVASARRNLTLLLDKYPASYWGDSAKLALGDCFIIEQELDKAVNTYQDFIDKNKKSSLLSLAHFRLAEAKRKAGLWDEARSFYEKIKTAFPNSLEANLSADILLRNEFYYTLQVGSFINGENARELAEKLVKTGFPAYITETVRLGQVFYRVRVGKYASRQESQDVKEKLARAGYAVRLYP